MIDRAKFFDAIRPMFGSLSTGQVSGTEALLTGWEASGASDLRWLAYILATARHETAGTMQPIAEYGHGQGRPYGVPDSQTGQRYYGRGFVQLTWKANYEKAGSKLGVDLTNNPDKAMDPAIAAPIAITGMLEGWFTGKRLADYFNGSSDWVNARRIINGLDQAEKIAGYGREFYAAIQKAIVSDVPAILAGGAAVSGSAAPQVPVQAVQTVRAEPISPTIPIPPPDPRTDSTPSPQPASSGFFSALIGALAAIFRR